MGDGRQVVNRNMNVELISKGNAPITMTFGKYKGCKIEDVPASYLAWALNNCSLLTRAQKTWIKENINLD